MRDYSKISTSIWTSQKFKAIKNDDTARLLYLYLQTCKHVNSVGCFVVPILYISADIGWDVTQCREGIDTLCRHRLIVWNEQEETIFLVKFMSFNEFMSPSHAKGSIKVALSLPDCQCKLLLMRDIIQQERAKDNKDVLNEIDRLETVLGLSEHTEPKPKPNTEPDSPTDSSTQNQLELKSENPEPPDEIAQAFEIFQSMARRAKLAVPAKLSEPRKAKLRNRLKDCGGIDGWETACLKVEASNFCTGGTGWFADLDFMLQESSFTKIMEGSYDNRSNSSKSSNGSGMATGATTAEIADRAAWITKRQQEERDARRDVGEREF